MRIRFFYWLDCFLILRWIAHICLTSTRKDRIRQQRTRRSNVLVAIYYRISWYILEGTTSNRDWPPQKHRFFPSFLLGVWVCTSMFVRILLFKRSQMFQHLEEPLEWFAEKRCEKELNFFLFQTTNLRTRIYTDLETNLNARLFYEFFKTNIQ